MPLRFSTGPAGTYGPASVRQRLRDSSREDTGGALPAVLLFIVAVGALVGSVLAVHQVRTRLVQQDIREVHLEYAAEAALARLVAGLHRGPFTELRGETLPCPSRALCRGWTERFGGLIRATVRAQPAVRGDNAQWQQRSSALGPGVSSHEIHVLIGQAAAPAVQPGVAAVLTDATSGLTLAGSARLSGTVVMAGNRVRPGLLNGRPFTGTNGAAVRQRRSPHLPPVQEGLREALIGRWATVFTRGIPGALPWREVTAGTRPIAVLESVFGPSRAGGAGVRSSRLGAFVSAPSEDTAARSPFRRIEATRESSLRLGPADQARLQRPITLFVRGSLTVEGPLQLPPGTRLLARDTLRITGPVEAPLLLLAAGSAVEVRGDARGIFQIGAGTSVDVTGARLRYPSTIVAGGRDRAPTGRIGTSRAATGRGATVPHAAGTAQPGPAGRLVLGDGTRADGTALYLPPPPFADASSGGRRSAGRADDGLVVIAPGAELRGLLYSAADAEVEGRLLGTLLARRLAAYRSPTHYRNWLIGGEVDPSARPAPFLVPIGLGPQADRTFETVPAPPPVSPEAVLRHSNDPRPKDAV